MPPKKGARRGFVDGAGICSPGRWPPHLRVLPDDTTARKLKDALLNCFKRCEKSWQSKHKSHDAKHILICLAAGKMKGAPFDQEAVAEARMDLRLICKGAGHGDGLPQEGDIVQAYEVRLVHALLSAFADPDWYFCDW